MVRCFGLEKLYTYFVGSKKMHDPGRSSKILRQFLRKQSCKGMKRKGNNQNAGLEIITGHGKNNSAANRVN